MVVEYEPPHRVREAAELAEQPAAPLGVAADDGELLLVETGWLLEDRVGDGELADVVEEAADREGTEPACGEAELIADLDGA